MHNVSIYHIIIIIIEYCFFLSDRLWWRFRSYLWELVPNSASWTSCGASYLRQLTPVKLEPTGNTGAETGAEAGARAGENWRKKLVPTGAAPPVQIIL